MKFYKDNDGIINASVKENDHIKDVVIYPRGNEFCFSMGNIGSKNMQTYFLTPGEAKTVNDLLVYDPVNVGPNPIRIDPKLHR